MPARSNAMLIGAVAVAVAVIVGLAVVLTRDDPPQRAVPANEITDEPAVTVSTTLAPTTVAPTTTIPHTTTSATTTVAPVARVATADNLVAALPTVLELPVGWEFSGDFYNTAPEPVTGPGSGFCGGDNAAARALAAGAVAMVHGNGYDTPEFGWTSTDLYAFTSAETSKMFMTLTRDQASTCSGGYEYSLPEGDGPGAYDGFSDEFGNDATWFLTDVGQVLELGVPGADEAFGVTVSSYSYTNYQDAEYGGTSTDVVQYERHGRVVFVTDLWGGCCEFGYNDLDPAFDYTPTVEQTNMIAQQINPIVLQRLVALNVI